MTNRLSVLRGDDIVINDKIVIHQPRLSDIASIGESKYYSSVYALCSSPSDYKVFLWDKAGVDWTEISDFTLFQILYKSIDPDVSSVLTPNVKFDEMVRCLTLDTGEPCIASIDGDVKIDETIYLTMTDIIRKMHGITKTCDKPGNETTKKFMLAKDRKRIERERYKKDDDKSVLEPLISAMVNCEHFKYDYASVWNMTVYQFMDAVRQIRKYKSIDYTMHGIYSGTIDPKDISSNDLNWMGDNN